MIVTVTPNPALDLTYSLAGAASGDIDVNRALKSTLEASGKGVNVSRALANAGLPTCAVLPAGGPAGRALVELLGGGGVEHRVTRQAGETRINTTAVWPGGETLKLNGPGAALTDAERRELLDETARALDAARSTTEGTVWLAVCGSLPPAVGPELVAELVDVARRSGARCVVDASGPALSSALDAGADLLAPNRSELAGVTSAIPSSGPIGELADAAASLARRTGSALLISLGPRGALYADGRHTIHGEGPPLTPVNTAGAGDALLAGWLAGDGDPYARLSRAITWSRSACVSDTTVDPAPGRCDTATITVVDLLP